MRHPLRILLVLPVLLLVSASAFAANATQTVTASAAVNARAVLTLGANTLTFADANPDSSPSLSPTEGAISVATEARTGANGSVTLTVVASDDFKSGSDVIGASNLTWTASGSGFVAGTMNKSTAQSVGSWTGSGTRNGSLDYSLANSWSYTTGNYSMTVTYTLTAP